MSTDSKWNRFESYSTEDLIDTFQSEDVTLIDKDDAFLAIVFRFRSELVEKCDVICRKRGYDGDTAIKIAERTFEKYGLTKAFSWQKAKSNNPHEAFLLYLFAIARNELNDYFNELRKAQSGRYYDGTEEVITKIPEQIVDSLHNTEVEIIHDILLDFSEKHRIIYLTYMRYELEGMKLPRALLKRLREKLHLNQNTIRAYKKEVIDKINGAKEILKKVEG